MRHSLSTISILLILLAAPAALAGHTESGPLVNTGRQEFVCAAMCDGSSGCDFTIRWRGPDGQPVASQDFQNVPELGIRQLAYVGFVSPISCAVDDESVSIAVSVLNRYALPQRVVAIQGNQRSDHQKPIVNPLAQYPVCTVNCSGPDSCDIALTWYDSQGNDVQSQSFINVPGGGARQLVYYGFASPLWCKPQGSYSSSNVMLVDRATFRIEASSQNEY